MSEKPVIERAFEIARSGACADLKDLESRLKLEGYAGIQAHLRSQTLSKQLRQIIVDSDASKVAT